ncbi:SDR family NAD(P)-dependent oxidoreductase, partial [bacterium]|nr:SDR family NAD(P)-dependent oxidoreductase [bacterium]
MTPTYSHALILGAGAGLSASLARLFAAKGLRVSLAARTTADLEALAEETGATLHTCDAARQAEIATLFAALDADGAPRRGGLQPLAPRPRRTAGPRPGGGRGRRSGHSPWRFPRGAGGGAADA